jgi:exodeoxyribonuclease V gamma subunit
VPLDDWLDGLRENAAGERGRIVLVSTGLIKDKKYRLDKVLPFWVAHLAGHLAGRPLTTVLVSKTGSVTLPPQNTEWAKELWNRLVASWLEAHTRVLPLAVETGFVWLTKGSGSQSTPEEALEAARKCFEGDDFDNGSGGGERDRNPYLARMFPDFEMLIQSGEFAHLVDALLRPLTEVV